MTQTGVVAAAAMAVRFGEDAGGGAGCAALFGNDTHDPQ
jgi:hypothetical protein